MANNVCEWKPELHENKPCPIHGAGGGLKTESRTTINEKQATSPQALKGKLDNKKFESFKKGEEMPKSTENKEDFDKMRNSVSVVAKDGNKYSYNEGFIADWVKGVNDKWEKYETFKESQGADGGMSPERIAFDDAEIQKEIESQAKFVGEPKYEKKATFVFGLPAAGKSTLSDPLKKEMGAFEIDADLMKRHIPEFAKDPQMVSAVHEESSYMSKKMFNGLTDKGANLVIGKVGGMKSYGSITKMINNLKSKGYAIDIVCADVDMEKALQANLGRFINRYIAYKQGDNTKSPRIVDTNEHFKTQKTYLDLAQKLYDEKLVGGFKVYDMNDRKNPKLTKTTYK